tara:strand:+ start:175 stop:390 length:216 start_codon:yes stop_codon:yes gene_type:complete
MEAALAQGMEDTKKTPFTPNHVRRMKNTLPKYIVAITMLTFLAACSGDKKDETSPLDDQPVPAPENPDIPQ